MTRGIIKIMVDWKILKLMHGIPISLSNSLKIYSLSDLIPGEKGKEHNVLLTKSGSGRMIPCTLVPSFGNPRYYNIVYDELCIMRTQST